MQSVTFLSNPGNEMQHGCFEFIKQLTPFKTVCIINFIRNTLVVVLSSSVSHISKEILFSNICFCLDHLSSFHHVSIRLGLFQPFYCRFPVLDFCPVPSHIYIENILVFRRFYDLLNDCGTLRFCGYATILNHYFYHYAWQLASGVGADMLLDFFKHCALRQYISTWTQETIPETL